MPSRYLVDESEGMRYAISDVGEPITPPEPDLVLGLFLIPDVTEAETAIAFESNMLTVEEKDLEEWTVEVRVLSEVPADFGYFEFVLSDGRARRENLAPYMMTPERNGVLTGLPATPGIYPVEAIAYSEDDVELERIIGRVTIEESEAPPEPPTDGALVIPPVPDGRVLWNHIESDIRNGDRVNLNVNRASDALMIADPGGGDLQVLRMLHERDRQGRWSERAETSNRNNVAGLFGQLHIYQFALFFPEESNQAAPNGGIKTQWHSQPDRGEPWRRPPGDLAQEGDDLVLELFHQPQRIGDRRNMTQVGMYPVPFLKNQWCYFEARVVWNPLSNNGRFDLFMNGEQYSDYRGALGYNDAMVPYFKQGNYKFAWRDTQTDNETPADITEFVTIIGYSRCIVR